jgi:cold shock CspA family protein
LRFDQIRGYGFIGPNSGGEDIFLHVNDLLDEKRLVTPGTVVEFEVEQGQRGLKASSVRVVKSVPLAPLTNGAATTFTGTGGSEDSDRLCDVLSAVEFTHEITELLLAIEPTLTGVQIVQTRRQLVKIAQKYGWVED